MSGVARCTSSSLPAGTNSIVAKYSGDAANSTSTSPALSQSVISVPDATASTNCTLLAIERHVFMSLLENNWPLAEAVLKLVCTRLRRCDELRDGS